MRGRRFEPWPWVVVGLLGSMVASSLAFYAVARSHPDPLVVADAYEAGRRYNALAREEDEAAARGWTLDVATRPAGEGIRIRVAVVDRRETPLPVDRVLVRRERPAEGGLDRAFRLEPGPDGYEGTIPLPRHGRWRLVVRAERDGRAVQHRVPVWRP